MLHLRLHLHHLTRVTLIKFPLNLVVNAEKRYQRVQCNYQWRQLCDERAVQGIVRLLVKSLVSKIVFLKL